MAAIKAAQLGLKVHCGWVGEVFRGGGQAREGAGRAGEGRRSGREIDWTAASPLEPELFKLALSGAGKKALGSVRKLKRSATCPETGRELSAIRCIRALHLS